MKNDFEFSDFVEGHIKGEISALRDLTLYFDVGPRETNRELLQQVIRNKRNKLEQMLEFIKTKRKESKPNE